MRRTIAYLRVSTIDQNLEKNKADILHLANDKDLGKLEFFEEKVSGKIPRRFRNIRPILEDLKKDDTILLSEFSQAWPQYARMYGNYFYCSGKRYQDLHSERWVAA